MAQTNKNLHTAKKEQNDEFYTQLSDIEKEMKYYRSQFKDKVIYCNCDDARQSNFFKFFSINFEFLGLKKLITTSYNKDGGHGTVLVYEGDKNGNGVVDDAEIEVSELEGNGDFASDECIEFLKEADIVVTNPPFSLFRKYIALLFEYDKKFLILGNMNAITYKEVFPYFIQKKLYLGISSFNTGMYFNIPDYVEYKNSYKFDREQNGQRVMRVPSICWFTNLNNYKADAPITLYKKYNSTEYKNYDNYDAINVDKVAELPYDYNGVIGVPITILDKLASDGYIHFDRTMNNLLECDVKYEIIRFRKGVDDKDLCVNGKIPYFRVLIKPVDFI